MNLHRFHRNQTKEYQDELSSLLNLDKSKLKKDQKAVVAPDWVVHGENKIQKSLTKMSRPVLRFPKFGTDPRAEQNVQPLETGRQKEIFGRKVANNHLPDSKNVPHSRSIRNSDGTITNEQMPPRDISYQPQRDKIATSVSGKFDRNTLGLNYRTTPHYNSNRKPKSFQSALAGKLRSKFEDFDESHPKKMEEHRIKKRDLILNHNQAMRDWSNSAPKPNPNISSFKEDPEYLKAWTEHRAQKPVAPKLPRAPSKKRIATKDLSPEQVAQRGRSVDSTIEHETLHNIFDTIAEKHGPRAAEMALNHAMSAFDTTSIGNLGKFARMIGYDPKSPSFKEELLTHARDILVNSKKRQAFKDSLTGKTPEEREKAVSNLKREYQSAYKISQNLDPKNINTIDLSHKMGKSELLKGKNGNWQKEGYSFIHSAKDPVFYTNTNGEKIKDYTRHKITANDKLGIEAGTYEFDHHHDPKDEHIHPRSSGTNKRDQRKGLANEAYRQIEALTGAKIKRPSRNQQTEDSKALHDQSNRAWGKSELRKSPVEFNDFDDSAQGVEQTKHKPLISTLVSQKKLPNGLSHHVYKHGKAMETHTHELHHPEHGLIGAMKVKGTKGQAPMIQTSVVHPKHRGQGYGSQLYSAALLHHGHLASDVQMSKPANAIWEKLGQHKGIQTKLSGYGNHLDPKTDVQPHYAKVTDANKIDMDRMFPKSMAKAIDIGKPYKRKYRGPADNLRGIPTGKLKQLQQDNHVNPDTGFEVDPEAVHNELTTRADKKGDKLISEYKKGMMKKPSKLFDPDDFIL